MAIDQRELDQRVKALMKSVAANEPADNAIKMLENLKQEAQPTEEMLRATKAGVMVNKLRSNGNKDIARGATELVVKWKKLVEQEKKSKAQSNKNGSPAPTNASLPASSPGAAATGSASASPAMAKKEFTGDPEKRKADTDGVSLERTDSKVRNQCIGLIYNGLAYRSREPAQDIIAHFKGEGAEYKGKIRSLFHNLKNKTNRELGRRVMAGSISPERFVTMSDEELKSDDLRKMEKELEEENMKKAQVPVAKKSVSDSLECSKCKKKMVSYTQAQTRSADEPMTTFCECMNCGKRWKVRDSPLFSFVLVAQIYVAVTGWR